MVSNEHQAQSMATDEFLAHMVILVEHLAHTVILADRLAHMMILLGPMTIRIRHSAYMTILNQLLMSVMIPGVHLSQPVAHGLQFRAKVAGRPRSELPH